MKQKILSIMLIGLLSMLFAEIFSGASQLWFINPFGVLYTYPLYMLHTVFFLSIAIKYQKTSIRQLYFFGVLFGLYEAVITKVLWQGYMHESGPALGTFLGVAVIEFPILTFFWHPIFSFILPVLTYQILSGHVLSNHVKILTPSKRKNIAIILMLIAISTFILNGNQQNLLSAFGALGGTVLLIGVVMLLMKGKPIKIERFGEMKLTWAIIGLIVIYLFGGVYLMPERFPDGVIPYATLGILYMLVSWFLYRSKPSKTEIILCHNLYSAKEMLFMISGLSTSIMVMSLIWRIGNIIMVIVYFGFTVFGFIIFFVLIKHDIKHSSLIDI